MWEDKSEKSAEVEVLEEAGFETKRRTFLPYELIRQARLRPQPPQMPGLSLTLTK